MYTARNKYKRRRKFKLFKRREIWIPTWQGWILAIALIISCITFAIAQIYPFLAVNAPISADMLVVEGWIPDYGIKAALDEFKSGSYKYLVTTGIPVERGDYLAEYKNFAEIAAATLRKMGLAADKITVISSPEVKKDRTYASAIAVRQWLEKNDIKPQSINLVSKSTHARRSWFLYKKVMNNALRVGIISVPTENYDARKWWTYSAGVRSVINETVAYLYALIVNWRA